MAGKFMGRPERLTPQLQKSICDLLAVGNFFSVACVNAGMRNAKSAYEWIRRGEGRSKRPWKQKYADFAAAVKIAIAKGEQAALLGVRKAARGGEVIEEEEIFDKESGKLLKRKIKRTAPNWFADAWFLERRHSKRWAKRMNLPEEDGNAPRPFRIIEYSTGGTGNANQGEGQEASPSPELP